MSQFLCGMVGSIFQPIANTLIAKSSDSSNRAGAYINFVSIGTFSFSIGYLMVAFVFLLYNDHWEKSLCRLIVGAGYMLQNISLIFLLFMKTEHFTTYNPKEQSKMKEEIGDNFFNPVLWGVFAHKLLDSFESLAFKQQAIFFKENMYMGPFYTTMVNFIAVNFGAMLSSLIMPKLCQSIGEIKTVSINGCLACILFLSFILS